MHNITTCSKCGKCYEESSEERANEPDRLCHECYSKEHIFFLGTLRWTPLITQKAQDASFQKFLWVCLHRHERGDWGDLDEHDKEANEKALKAGTRILSEYHFDTETKVWIVTEDDRTVTTILFPSEY